MLSISSIPDELLDLRFCSLATIRNKSKILLELLTQQRRSNLYSEIVFNESFGYEEWLDYVLKVPMYFVYREGEYIDVSGRSFLDFMDGKLEGFAKQCFG